MNRFAISMFAAVLAAPHALASTSDIPAVALSAADTHAQSADLAWMLIATALVLIMTPGLALFYGGMVERRHVVGTIMHSLAAMAIVATQWLLLGYCLAFGASRGGLIGWSPEFLGLSDPVILERVYPGTKIPIIVHFLFQGMFAIITPAIISGAFAERVRFAPYCLFILFWSIIVYAPLAHWVWALGADGKPAGWLGAMGALDFAGGTVVHIAAGFSGLAAVLILPKRAQMHYSINKPNSTVITIIGTGLLWFGWFGFNGGSAMACNPLAALAIGCTQIGAVGGGVAWMAAEWLHRGKPTVRGLASGFVAGLVAVTPACAFVAPLAAILIGVITSFVCYIAVYGKEFLQYDDTLDAFGIHGVGGLIGAICTGLFASATVYKACSGSDLPVPELLGGGWLGHVGVQVIAAAAAAAYSFAITAVLIKIIDKFCGFCASPDAVRKGLDVTQHGEYAYDFVETRTTETAAFTENHRHQTSGRIGP